MKQKKENKKVNYKTVTKEELVEKINKNNLNIKYYFPMFDDDFEKGYDKLSRWITMQPILISGAEVYYDVNCNNIDSPEWLEKMIKNIQQNDVVIVRNLINLLPLLNYDFLVFLTKVYGLYILDYENENFIEIDINLLLKQIMQIYSEVGRCAVPSLFMERFEELSVKHYDSKL